MSFLKIAAAFVFIVVLTQEYTPIIMDPAAVVTLISGLVNSTSQCLNQTNGRAGRRHQYWRNSWNSGRGSRRESGQDTNNQTGRRDLAIRPRGGGRGSRRSNRGLDLARRPGDRSSDFARWQNRPGDRESAGVPVQGDQPPPLSAISSLEVLPAIAPEELVAEFQQTRKVMEELLEQQKITNELLQITVQDQPPQPPVEDQLDMEVGPVGRDNQA